MTCIHHTLTAIRGKINFTASTDMTLHVHGTFAGLDPARPVEVVVQSSMPCELPWWLRAYATCARSDVTHARVKHDVCYVDGRLDFTSSLVDFSAWQLQLPYLPGICLERVIGKRSVHVVLQQSGAGEFGRLVIQRRRHCVHLVH
jgi:hypothetical protein